jgi:uncharacterized protein YjiS (DUF1127 family)
MKTSTRSLSYREFGASLPFSAPRGVGRKALNFLANLVAEWRRRALARRQYQSLRHLDDRILQDIGLTRSQVDFEATRTIWWR